MATLSDPQAALDFGFRPLQGSAWYKRAQAFLLSHGNGRYEGLVSDRKRALFSPLQGDVVEIGPGGGPNLGFFDRRVRWIGVEPNPFFHAHLRATAARLRRDIDVRVGTAERLPLPDGCADAVVCSLVLCSVRDVGKALREIQRVLRPGGRFVFLEHVAAPEGTGRNLIQRVVRPLWGALGDGCRADRDTEASISSAGFSSVDLSRFDVSVPVFSPHIAGIAENS